MNFLKTHALKLSLFAVLLLVLNLYGSQIINQNKEENNQEELFIIPKAEIYDKTANHSIVSALDSLANLKYFKLCSSCEQEEQTVKKITKDPESIVSKRLKTLDRQTPFHLTYNKEVQYFIDLYGYRKRRFTSKLLGLSDMYFPIFEELLDRYELPLEFKYLAVVESALNPSIKSHAGAVGLWQFMLNTGKAYDLKVNSYEDLRRDPYKSTEAACRYFQDLYSIYKDWELVLAAYNCGPGNVNKAIRRSGNKKSYWKLWPYLPKETRGYVPAFIAVNYVMSYANELKIYPSKPIKKYFEYDTLQVNKRIDLNLLAYQLDIPFKVLKTLNPAYKLDIIPQGESPKNLYLPITKIGAFLDQQDQIFAKSREIEKFSVPDRKKIQMVHHVLKGETLESLAKKYNCSTAQILHWNDLKEKQINEGQKLVVGFDRQKDKS